MTKFGGELIRAAREAAAIARGELKPATLRLLEVAERHPEVILDAVAPKKRDNGR